MATETINGDSTSERLEIADPINNNARISGNGGADTLVGGNLDDTLQGGEGDDDLIGGRGPDTLSGGDGFDDYFHGVGDGFSFINDFESINATRNRGDELLLARDDHGAGFVRLTAITDAYTVVDGDPEGSGQRENAFIRFDNGDLIEIFDQYGVSPGEASSDIVDGIEVLRVFDPLVIGSATSVLFLNIPDEQDVIDVDEPIIGDSDSEFIFATRQSERLFGNGGRDLIFASDGDDEVDAGNQDDILHASGGTNLLRGGGQNDLYLWNASFTAVNLIEEESGVDRIATSFAAAGLSNVEITGPGGGRDLVLETFDAETRRAQASFTIRDQFSPFDDDAVVEFVNFNGVDYALQSVFSESGTAGSDLIAGLRNQAVSIQAEDGADAVFTGDLADVLGGGGGNDLLSGGGGADRLFGGGDDDTLRGGAGADLNDGGAGRDLVDFTYSFGGVLVRLWAGDGGWSTAAGDRFRGIEDVLGSVFNDRLEGNGFANVLIGGTGNDTLRGFNGDDRLRGDRGADLIEGGGGGDAIFGGLDADDLRGDGGNDFLSGDAGGDLLGGGAGRDDLRGGGGADRLFGGDDADQLRGNEGGDLLRGGNGADTLWGGAQNDRLFGEFGDDLLFGDGGDDTLSGGAGRDDVGGGFGDDQVFGDAGDDRLFGADGADDLGGGAGNDLLFGGAGADRLFGSDGADRLQGDGGNDLLFGGAGRDSFVYQTAGGTDRARDFTVGLDQVDATALNLANGGQARALARQVGADTHFGLTGQGTLILEDVAAASLTNADFLI